MWLHREACKVGKEGRREGEREGGGRKGGGERWERGRERERN